MGGELEKKTLEENKNLNELLKTEKSKKNKNRNKKEANDGLNINEQKENIELYLDENNMRRANSFITNNKKINKKQQLEEIKENLEKEYEKIKNSNKNINIKNSINIIEAIFEDKKYENDLDKIKIKLLENNDIFIGLLDIDNILPKKGILLTHNGDYYNGEFSEGKKMAKEVSNI